MHDMVYQLYHDMVWYGMDGTWPNISGEKLTLNGDLWAAPAAKNNTEVVATQKGP